MVADKMPELRRWLLPCGSFGKPQSLGFGLGFGILLPLGLHVFLLGACSVPDLVPLVCLRLASPFEYLFRVNKLLLCFQNSRVLAGFQDT